ncbi:hypothetical protein C8J56DRAFT_884844 [Mycena floridula]|nr:hypothetical protein C8J56DRAFT_884844 [Mycena floridula]
MPMVVVVFPQDAQEFTNASVVTVGLDFDQAIYDESADEVTIHPFRMRVYAQGQPLKEYAIHEGTISLEPKPIAWTGDPICRYIALPSHHYPPVFLCFFCQSSLLNQTLVHRRRQLKQRQHQLEEILLLSSESFAALEAASDNTPESLLTLALERERYHRQIELVSEHVSRLLAQVDAAEAIGRTMGGNGRTCGKWDPEI